MYSQYSIATANVSSSTAPCQSQTLPLDRPLDGPPNDWLGIALSSANLGN